MKRVLVKLLPFVFFLERKKSITEFEEKQKFFFCLFFFNSALLKTVAVGLAIMQKKVFPVNSQTSCVPVDEKSRELSGENVLLANSEN